MVDTGFWVPPERRSLLATSCVSTRPGEIVASNAEGFTGATASRYQSGGQGLVATAGDYLRFARMLMQDGELEGVRLLQSATARTMRRNRFTEEQRRYPFMAGTAFTQGFGLGMSVVIDERQPGVVTGKEGTFGWPGGFGGWWQADPQEELILLWLQQCTPARRSLATRCRAFLAG